MLLVSFKCLVALGCLFKCMMNNQVDYLEELAWIFSAVCGPFGMCNMCQHKSFPLGWMSKKEAEEPHNCQRTKVYSGTKHGVILQASVVLPSIFSFFLVCYRSAELPISSSFSDPSPRIKASPKRFATLEKIWLGTNTATSVCIGREGHHLLLRGELLNYFQAWSFSGILIGRMVLPGVCFRL